MMTEYSTLDIRTAREADLPDLRALIVDTWHATYDATMGPDRVTAITDDWHSLERLGREISHPQAYSLIAVDDDGVLGHALLLTRDGDKAELSRLYVSPKAQGGGIGASLLAAVLAKAASAKSVWLEVEEANERAQHFYAKHGFTEIERRSNCGDQDGIPTLILSKPLA